MDKYKAHILVVDDDDGISAGHNTTCDLPEKLYLGFTTGFCIARISTLGIYLHTMWLDQKARIQFRYTVLMQSTSLFIIILTYWDRFGLFPSMFNLRSDSSEALKL